MTKKLLQLLVSLALLCEGNLIGGMQVVVVQDKDIPRSDLLAFINTTEPIWTYRGNQALDENITCKVDYQFAEVNDTTYTFHRNYTEKNASSSHKMNGRLVVSKGSRSKPQGLCTSWVVTDDLGVRMLEILIYQTANHTCGVFYVLPLTRSRDEHDDALLTEDDFFCELRMKDSITSIPAPPPPRGGSYQVVNRQPPSDCLEAYTDHCTGRGKHGDTQVYRHSCKAVPGSKSNE
uniref:Putative lipocalin-3 1 n=1 Tax=Amblyomma americanum TaxID=6943 RepID=A0A0C9S5E8_AMBAM